MGESNAEHVSRMESAGNRKARFLLAANIAIDDIVKEEHLNVAVMDRFKKALADETTKQKAFDSTDDAWAMRDAIVAALPETLKNFIVFEAKKQKFIDKFRPRLDREIVRMALA